MNYTTIEQWAEWKKHCALAPCAVETRAVLARFAATRFRKYVALYDPELPLPGDSEEEEENRDADCWHLFETHAVAGRRKDGKFYKDWLLDRICSGMSGTPIALLETGASLLIRTAAREYAYREGYGSEALTRARFVSTNEETEDGDPVHELPSRQLDPSRAADTGVYVQAARQICEAVFARMPAGERIAMLAKILDISLAAPVVCQAVGVKPTQVNARFWKAAQALDAAVEGEFAGETPEALECLRVHCAATLRQLVLEWAESQAECAPLFLQAIQEGGNV